ncbi:MAG: SbcC/MukB-like Walker B domain-containing protein [Aggregatilineales bacterium]
MMNLFNQSTGFRLARLEIYNWGTFDGHIWTMSPDGQTGVLTGANGSGKSTVVDALLTLLVEPRQRNYNLASGAGSSRERNERTYIRGQYSRSRGDSAIDARANTLRDQQAHSVLLGVFQDIAHNRTVTLAQILWIGNSERVEKRYYIAPCDLTIEKHFPQRLISTRDLPKEVESFGSVFKDYIAAARKALGLGGRPKALDLFNETVAVKDIASLNTFVRDHMLDKGDPESRVDALRTQYRELNDAHASIQRASNQLHILSPLIKAGNEYRRYEDQIARYDAAKSLVPFYVADQARQILGDAIGKTNTLCDAEQSKLDGVDNELSNRRDELEQVKISIAQDNVGQMKREIEGKIAPLKRVIDALKRAADRYDESARLLEFPVYKNEDDFYQNREKAEHTRHTVNNQLGDLEHQRFELETERRDAVEKGKELDKEIQYLKANPSNIPANVARIRQEVSSALNIPLDELPFVGELLKVRPEDAMWEGALERLLNSFAQDLIISDAIYARVSRYVNDNNLRGRLVYRRVDPTQRMGRLPERREQQLNGEMAHYEMAYDKLQIVANTPYHDWLSMTLMQKFSYACCENLADFQQAEKALTPEGQIRHSATRHEKDDRRNINDRRNYVLGWDNREKLRQLDIELDDLQRLISKQQEQMKMLEADLERGRRDISALENLLKVAEFREIDWRTPQSEHDQLQRRLTELNQQSQQLQRLEKQRDDLQQQVKEIEQRRDKITGEIRSLTDKIQNYQQLLKVAERQLTSVTDAVQNLWERVGDVIQEIDKDPLTIESLNNRTQELEVFIQRGIATFKGVQNRSEAVILDSMNTFRREYPDEGVSLTATIASLGAFERIFNQLETDDLPKYEERFKQMLDRTVTRGIQVFSSHLTEQERAIDRSIAELNDSLAKVDYGGGSIIRLIAERTNDPEVNDFQRELKGCIPNAGDNTYEELDRAYTRIKALITHFDDDPNWMRRVIDVRRWRVFAAEQIDSEGRQVDYYSDSSGKSGGQKAKLAYTILASAIAHQYGLQDAMPNDRSFRFVVIDEAFSKLDDDNARYAMKLFDQLGLQLLVVTPMQQLHVIESYVHAYHVVVNNNEGSYSRLFNLTQGEYRQRRREFQAQEHQA